jgi:putative addiction module component (TIGR02574 family)
VESKFQIFLARILAAPLSHGTEFEKIITGARMNPTTPSIFDLSPSEKLQLVEDLWDDLAATPEAVPIHDWQRQELARRKANLIKNPASGLAWKEVKRRVPAHHRGGSSS